MLQKEIANAKKQIMQGGGPVIGANQSMIDRAKDMVKKADEKKPVVNENRWPGDKNDMIVKPPPSIRKPDTPVI
jgi:hypothetical protein